MENNTLDETSVKHELDAVSLEERMKLLEYAANWLTAYLDGDTRQGAYAESKLG